VNEVFLRNGDIRLHVVDSAADSPGQCSLLIVPGLSESAEDYVDLIESLAPRRCIAVTLRGRGRSGAPEAGYSLEDHVGDVAAARSILGSDRFCLMAVSRGVAYALGYAVGHASELTGLILADYPALHSRLPPAFPQRFIETTWRGKPVAERMPLHAVRAIQREAIEVAYWDVLPAIETPTLILHGAQERGSLLAPSDIERYNGLPHDPTVVSLPGSGHDLRSPDPAPFNQAVQAFLLKLDAARH
jgi:pimeloyl-ACP methyl ester carboxylesterase